jgi:hypothetical protein
LRFSAHVGKEAGEPCPVKMRTAPTPAPTPARRFSMPPPGCYRPLLRPRSALLAGVNALLAIAP